MIDLITIVLVNLAMYLPILWNEPVVDDIQWLKKKNRRWFNIVYGAGTFKNEYIDRFFTIILFTTIAILIYYAFGCSQTAYICSLLYTLNPINNQISMWRNGRRYQIVIIITLLIMINPWFVTLYPLIPFLQVSGLPAIIIYLFSGINYYAISGTLIAVFLLYLLNGRIGHDVITSFIKVRYHKIPKGERLALKPQKIIVAIKTLGFYIVNTIVPTTKYMYYSYLQFYDNTKEGTKDAYSINFNFIWASSIILILVGYGVCKGGIVGWCVIMWFIFMLPWSNVITLTQTITDRYCSLPAVFLMYIVADIVAGNPTLLTAFVLCYALANLHQLRMYRNVEEYLNFHVYNDPLSLDARIYWVVNLMHGKQWLDAWSLLSYGYRYFPDNYKINLLMAKICLSIKPQQCEYFLSKAENNMYPNEIEQSKRDVAHIRQELNKMLKK